MTSSNDTDQTVKIPADNSQTDENQMTPCIFSRLWVFLLVFLIGIAGTTLMHSMKPELFSLEKTEIKSSGQIEYSRSGDKKDEQLAKLMQRVDELESTITALKEKPAPLSEEGEAIIASDDFNKLKEGVKTLFETSEKIGSKLEAAINEAVTGQTSMRTNVATLMSFIQMKDKTLQGISFENELKTIQGMLRKKDPLQATLTKLEPFAKETVASHMDLFLQWKTLSPKVDLMMRQDEAEDWKDRILLALEGLISVKPLNVENKVSQNLVQSINTDLQKANVAQALETANSLPANIRDGVLKDWIKKTTDHVEVQTLLSEVSNKLIPQAKKELPKSKKTEGKK